MTIQEALTHAAHRLHSVFPQDQAWSDTERLLAHLLDTEVTFILAHPEASLPLRKHLQLARLVTRRLRHEPMEYLLGMARFRRLTLRVNKHTLIPRIETEDLIDRALNHLTALPAPTCCVDLGTGSGAILLSLASENVGAHQTTTTYLGTDISARALRVARTNADTLLPGAPISFLQTAHFSHLLQDAIKKNKPASLLILANLPYVPPEDLPTMHASVVTFEPHSALFAPDHGRADIRIVLEQLSATPWISGLPFVALFEGDPEYIHTLQPVAEQLFPRAQVTIHHDVFDRPRFLEVISQDPRIQHRSS